MFLIRGFVFTYEAVRGWEAKLIARIGGGAAAKPEGQSRPQQVRRSRYSDETYIRVHGEVPLPRDRS